MFLFPCELPNLFNLFASRARQFRWRHSTPVYTHIYILPPLSFLLSYTFLSLYSETFLLESSRILSRQTDSAWPSFLRMRLCVCGSLHTFSLSPSPHSHSRLPCASSHPALLLLPVPPLTLSSHCLLNTARVRSFDNLFVVGVTFRSRPLSPTPSVHSTPLPSRQLVVPTGSCRLVTSPQGHHFNTHIALSIYYCMYHPHESLSAACASCVQLRGTPKYLPNKRIGSCVPLIAHVLMTARLLPRGGGTDRHHRYRSERADVEPWVPYAPLMSSRVNLIVPSTSASPSIFFQAN